MDNLELKHLVGYLPYGLKINTLENELYSIDVKNKKLESLFRGHLINIYEWDEIKPILKPLTRDTIWDLIIHTDDFHEVVNAIDEDTIEYIRHDLFMLLIENNIDVFGLIEKGLAIDINTLK